MIVPLAGHHPKIGNRCFIAPDAWIIGDCEIADDISVFFGAVLRGDLLPIRVGSGTNIQEHSLLHTTSGRAPTIVGEHVTIGHRAIVHGCTVESCSLIGMGATVLDEAIVGEQCLIGAGALVTEGKKIPPRSLVVGVPGKVVRQLDDSEVLSLEKSAEEYVKKGHLYIAEGVDSLPVSGKN